MADAFNGKPQQIGGLALYAKKGSGYMAEIGRRGYETTVNRHFDGDRQAANKWLAAKGRFAVDNQIISYGHKFADPGLHPARAKKGR